MRKCVAGAVAASILTLGVTASAELGEEGTFALSADRLFGITSFNATADPKVPGSVETEHKGTSTSLLWGGTVTVDNIPVPAAMPRASFDYFVIDGLSLGGSLGFFTSGGETKVGPASGDWADVTGYAFAPRVGYNFNISDTWSFWLRGGPMYMSVNFDPSQGNDLDVSVFQLEVDGMFVAGLTEGFGITFGPSLALPLGGEWDAGQNYDVDVKVLSFGVYAGLVGWL